MDAKATDEELLTSVDPEAFGAFYARHLAGVEAYFARRVQNRETAADLAAETFASALVARRRFVPGGTPAAGWLYTIAARRLVDFQRRGIVERRARETLPAEARVSAQWSSPVLGAEPEPGLLRHLPTDQSQAVAEHVSQRAVPGDDVRQRWGHVHPECGNHQVTVVPADGSPQGTVGEELSCPTAVAVDAAA